MQYRMKKVLVTGAGGFIGSHLCEALVGAGAEVTAMIHYSSRSDWGNLEFLPPDLRAQLKVVAGNIEESHFVILMNDAGDDLFPVCIVHEYKEQFPVPAHPFALFAARRSYMLWKIYQLGGAPRAAFENLDTDRWMSGHAELWVRDPSGPMTLRFTSNIPEGAQYANALTIYAGESAVARCPGVPPGVSRCTVDLASIAGRTSVEGWVRLEMRAARTFAPRDFGTGADSRNLSFNFKPTWQAGAGKLFSPPEPTEQH
jgi:hypothetical protein